MSSGDVDVQVNPLPGNGQLASVTSTYQIPPVPPGFVPRGQRPYAAVNQPTEPLVLSVLKKRWWLLLLCGIAAGLGAFAIAQKLGKESVKVEGSLTYKGLPGLRSNGAFTPLAVETYSELLTEPEFLQRVTDKLGLPISAQELAQLIEREANGRFRTIGVTLQWGEDREEAVKVLDEILDAFIERAAEWRNELVQDHKKHVERLLLGSTARVEDAAQRLRAFQQKMGLTDHTLSQLPNTLNAAQAALETAELNKQGFEVQLKTLAERRKQQLTELNNKVLETKRNRMKGAAALYSPGHKQWKRIQEVLKELDAAAPKAAETEPLVWKKTIDTIGKDVLTEPDLAAAAEIALLEDNLAISDGRKTELEIALLTKTEEIEMLKVRLTDKEGKFKELNEEMRPQAATEKELMDEVDNAAAEKKDYLNQLQNLNGIEAGRSREFQKMRKAAIAVDGISSSHKRIFALAFVGLSVLLTAPIFGCEYFLRRESPADETARKFGLPVLSRGALDDEIVSRGRKREEEQAADDPLRLLALRIQQSVHRPGSVIVFSALDHEESPIALICKLAVCFAERDEMVLVLDASGPLDAHRQPLGFLFQGTPHRTPDGHVVDPTLIDTPGSTTVQTFGIADYLSMEYLELADLAIPTRFQGVDCIHGGVRSFPREGLATRRMTELLEQCRHRYSMILIAGPCSHQHTDLQLIAARADGLLFTVQGDSQELRHSQEVLQDLLDLDAPIMGLIG